MTQKQKITKKIDLSFDLTKYLISHPKTANKYNVEDFIVFAENNKVLNEASGKLLKEVQKEGKKVIKATKKTGPQNRWNFELATP